MFCARMDAERVRNPTSTWAHPWAQPDLKGSNPNETRIASDPPKPLQTIENPNQTEPHRNALKELLISRFGVRVPGGALAGGPGVIRASGFRAAGPFVSTPSSAACMSW